MTIYHISEMVRKALPLAATSNNISAGFINSDICPFNPLVFTDINIMPSYVIDRPLIIEIEIQLDPIMSHEHNQEPDPTPSSSRQLDILRV